MRENNRIGITAESFAFELDTADGLTARRWRNKLTGETLDLGGGVELEVEVDAAKARIWIEGWHVQRGEKAAVAPDAESGFKAGYQRPDYPDIHEHLRDSSRWQPSPGLFDLLGDATYWAWARTRLFLPESIAGEPLQGPLKTKNHRANGLVKLSQNRHHFLGFVRL